MTLKINEIILIRDLYEIEHKSISEIQKITGRSYRAVTKYLNLSDFNDKQPESKKKGSKLDKWKPMIDQWLTEDLKAKPKQRHTAKKIFEDLSELEGFDCSPSTVRRYVRKKKNELKLNRKKQMIPLVHDEPGIGQGDFGCVTYILKDEEIDGREVVLSFPYSNGRFCVLTYGENAECLLESLDAIFRFIGGVPPVLWLDNGSSMISQIFKAGGRKMAERFERFCMHYGIRAVFMNPNAGNEKGNVESAVGYQRRNFYPGTPKFDNLDEYNQLVLEKCMKEIRKTTHYKRGVNCGKLFEQDRQKLLPLPEVRFDTSSLKTYKTNVTGMFKADKDRWYSTSPDYRNTVVYVRFTAREVTVLDKDLKTVVVTHKRLYGKENHQSIIWGPYLRAMSYKPRSYWNSGLRKMLPDELDKYMMLCRNDERHDALSVLADVYDQAGEAGVLSFSKAAASRGCLTAESIKQFYDVTYGTAVQAVSEADELGVLGAAMKKAAEQKG